MNRPEEATELKPQHLQLVSFLLGKEVYALDVLKIQGVERIPEITKIPKLPESVEGVINLRGEIIPIVDLRKRFGITARDPDKESRIVLIELKDTVAGLIVDKVFEVFQLESSRIGKIPKLYRMSVDTRFVLGIAEIKDKLVIVLDVDKVFTDEEIEEISV